MFTFGSDLQSVLKGKVVIVTGSSSGIGKATAMEFASRGSKVVLAARNLSELESVKSEIESQGGECIAVQSDVSIEEQCKNLINKALDSYGRIDILINNAGISIRAILEDVELIHLKK